MKPTAGAWLLVVLFINAFAFLAQAGIDSIGGDGQTFAYEGSMIESYDAGNNTVKAFSSDELPTVQGSINNEGGLLTDIFGTLKDWLLNIPGVKQLVQVVDAVPNFLRSIHVPAQIAFAVGFCWHALAVFLLVEFIRG